MGVPGVVVAVLSLAWRVRVDDSVRQHSQEGGLILSKERLETVSHDFRSPEEHPYHATGEKIREYLEEEDQDAAVRGLLGVIAVNLVAQGRAIQERLRWIQRLLIVTSVLIGAVAVGLLYRPYD